MTTARPLQEVMFKPPITWTAPTELPSLRGVKRLAFDVETRDPQLEELGPGVRRDGYIVGLALGTDDGRRWYLPVRHEGGGNLDEGLVQRWARAELNAFDGEVVGANLVYDLDYAAHEPWGVTFPHVKVFHDVQLAEPILDEWRYEYNLDALSRDYLGEGKQEDLLREVAALHGWKGNKQVKANLWRLPAGYVGPYGEGDVDRPLRILPLQLERLEADGQSQIYDLERRLLPVLLASRRRGVKVNLEKAQRIREYLVKLTGKWLAEVRRLSSPKAELLQPESFYQALQARGLHVPLTPKTRQPSITKEFFERNRGDELVDALAAGRRVNTLRNTFLDGHVLGHHVNGRVHCNFNQLKSDKGGTIARLSSSDPNLQNIPSRKSDFDDLIGFDDTVVSMIRGMFEPEENEVWQSDDFSQIEYRLLVHYAIGAGAEEARQKYREDPKTDYHKLVAEMLGVDPEDKVRRKRVKNTNFAKGYGAGVDKLAVTFGCSKEEAAAFVEEYERKLPFAKKTYDKAMEWADRRGFVETILGRKQRFPLWEPPRNYGSARKRALPRDRALAEYGPGIRRADTYKALNRKLQGSGADLMKKSMVDAWEAGVCDVLGAFLLTVHDENDTSVPRTPAGDEAARELTRIMERAVELKVPVLVETKRGQDWGACS